MAATSQIKIERTPKGKIKTIIIKPGETESPFDDIIDAAVYENAIADAEFVDWEQAKKQLDAHFKRKKNVSN